MIESTTKAFQWAAQTSAKKHYLMVSILPYLDTMTALATGEKIVLDFKAHAFDTDIISIVLPTQPDAATDPDTYTIGAKSLIASSIAIATVVSTLF